MTTMFEKAVNAAIDTGQVEGRLSANAIVGAVLEAIREPDAAMITAIDCTDERYTILGWWKFMIDEILKGAK